MPSPMRQSDIETLRRFIADLSRGGMPPDSNGLKVIDRIAEARDPAALPILRRALGTTRVYKTRAEASAKRVDPMAPGSASFWIVVGLATEMESKLHNAITLCTPEGASPTYGQVKRWWEFWK